jgi:hypothetical protein
MARETGKQFEWKIARDGQDDLAATFQDYDWADEVLHAQIGRRWLQSEFENYAAMQKHFEQVLPVWVESSRTFGDRSGQEPWWEKFLEVARTNAQARQSTARDRTELQAADD